MTSQDFDGSPEQSEVKKVEGGALPADTQPLLEGSIASGSLARNIEQDLELLSSVKVNGVTAEVMDALTRLRGRQNQDAIAERLGALMMQGANKRVRELAEFALVGTGSKVGQELLGAEYAIRELSRPDDKFDSGPENAEELVAELAAVSSNPIVLTRMTDLLIKGGGAAPYVAEIIQEMEPGEAHLVLRNALVNALESKDREKLIAMWKIPQALRNCTDSETQALIIAVYREGHEFFSTNNLRHNAARALGNQRTEAAKTAILESVFSTGEEWHVRRGIAAAIREMRAEEIEQSVLPLIDGSVIKTAWVVSGTQSGHFGLGRIPNMLGMLLDRQRRGQLYDIRVQVALGLVDEHPKLAFAALDGALKGKRDHFTHSCHLFEAGDALQAIGELEAA